MTTTEWQTCTDPAVMLESLADCEDCDEFLRFAHACCRRVWDHMPDPRIRAVAEIVERWLNGAMGPGDLGEALEDAHDAINEAVTKLQETKDSRRADELSRQIGVAEAILF